MAISMNYQQGLIVVMREFVFLLLTFREVSHDSAVCNQYYTFALFTVFTDPAFLTGHFCMLRSSAVFFYCIYLVVSFCTLFSNTQ